MDEQGQDDQLESIYNRSVPIKDVDLKTYRERWAIETVGRRGLGRSMLAARHDDYYYSFEMNAITGMEFEPAYYDVAIQSVNPKATRTFSKWKNIGIYAFPKGISPTWKVDS